MGEIVPTTLNTSPAIPQSQKHCQVRSYNLYSTNIIFFAEKVEGKEGQKTETWVQSCVWGRLGSVIDTGQKRVGATLEK